MDKHRLRFNLNDDLILLREVLSQNPFEDYGRWITIQENVHNATLKLFSIRALREHLQNVMANFLKEDNTYKKKSGTEEQYAEIHLLLQDTINLAKEFCRSARMKQQKSSAKAGIAASDKCVSQSELSNEEIINTPAKMEEVMIITPNIEDVSSSGCTSTATTHMAGTTSRKKGTMLNLFRKRQQQERIVKKEEMEMRAKQIRLEESALEVEREKLRLEEEKFKFEKQRYESEAKERDVRLKMEIEERTERLRVEREQREMLMMLLKTVIDKNNI